MTHENFNTHELDAYSAYPHGNVSGGLGDV